MPARGVNPWLYYPAPAGLKTRPHRPGSASMPDSLSSFSLGGRSRTATVVLAALLVLVAGAGAYLLLQKPSDAARPPVPVPLDATEDEVVWLFAATNNAPRD